MSSTLEASSSSTESSPESPLKSPLHPEYKIVFFDLETTGLEPNCEILQIAAKYGSRMYRTYILPTGPIPQIVKDITGIDMKNNKMYVRGRPVTAVPKSTALYTFIAFLKSLGGKIILVAHNCFKFDGPLLTAIVYREKKMTEFQEMVIGFSDTLPLFREYLPGRREIGRTYGLKSLADEFLGESAGAHDAMNDTCMLEQLIMRDNIPINVDDIIFSYEGVDVVSRMFHKNWRRYCRSPETWDTWKL
ncbi:three prime repair exonuclease 2 [Fopius arisanus]|uniref:TREX2_0 protein n=1 Tax=Fopius arisanus TaxID=64838 RepID=A0A0C9R8P8_9HYME|nr:PREDICTED: three prime repair exonuclease 2-like [Fopius arisanus]XP_011309362.1 PREDICTED: three prime repair exonuclease 2-like [Fopius arisanus]XP_011309363.1 PREDICTED: three prime repair exonuclease 2-like [Fopius arisanus]XP_011309364.1 PREDICTED: three prime repair exonuclease 2-like [Fopius arisanus]XP_011309366.1 PREDICTED: three prime repair exonuclease 2-like [Fopius arisanus]XP_011309367.1 PREDICTED: three prime repair exonuclease 2-like [Fopius arisanus]